MTVAGTATGLQLSGSVGYGVIADLGDNLDR